MTASSKPICMRMQATAKMKPAQLATPASPTSRARSAPFSVHSRGVMLFDQHRLLDGKFIGLSIFRYHVASPQSTEGPTVKALLPAIMPTII